jgi:transglutaminase-like putative cysteine protease
MRIFVRHDVTHRFAEPARFAIQRLLLTPRNYAGQHVRAWRVEVDRDCRLREREDAFGNVMQSLSLEGPIDAITTTVEGDIETFDTSGVVRGAVERLPPALYLRDTTLTAPDAALKGLAADIEGNTANALDRLHALTARLNESFEIVATAEGFGAGAAAAYAERKADPADAAHVFVSVARLLQMPARFVSGYLWRDADDALKGGAHAWAEAHVDSLGWVGFDPALGLSPGEAHVRLAIGLDGLDAAPVRASRAGFGDETIEVAVRIAAEQRQAQA